MFAFYIDSIGHGCQKHSFFLKLPRWKLKLTLLYRFQRALRNSRFMQVAIRLAIRFAANCLVSKTIRLKTGSAQIPRVVSGINASDIDTVRKAKSPSNLILVDVSGFVSCLDPSVGVKGRSKKRSSAVDWSKNYLKKARCVERKFSLLATKGQQ